MQSCIVLGRNISSKSLHYRDPHTEVLSRTLRFFLCLITDVWLFKFMLRLNLKLLFFFFLFFPGSPWRVNVTTGGAMTVLGETVKLVSAGSLAVFHVAAHGFSKADFDVNVTSKYSPYSTILYKITWSKNVISDIRFCSYYSKISDF